MFQNAKDNACLVLDSILFEACKYQAVDIARPPILLRYKVYVQIVFIDYLNFVNCTILSINRSTGLSCQTFSLELFQP